MTDSSAPAVLITMAHSHYSEKARWALDRLALCDYSRGDRLQLDENHLNETLGMCTSTTVPVDWNRDFNYDPSVAVDINGDDDFCPGKTVLHDYNDWAHINLSSVSPLLQQLGHGPSGQRPVVGLFPHTRGSGDD